MMSAHYHLIVVIVAALVLSPRGSEAQTALTITGGEDAPLRGGTLLSLHGCRHAPGTGGRAEPAALHILYAVPDHERRWGSDAGGSDTSYVVTKSFQTADGRTLAADTVIIVNGERVHIGRASFDLAVGNLFVVYVREGPDGIRQLATHLVDTIDVAGRLAVFQRALPGDSIVQAIAPRYESYGSSLSDLARKCS